MAVAPEVRHQSAPHAGQSARPHFRQWRRRRWLKAEARPGLGPGDVGTVLGLSSPTASRDRGRLQTCRELREARSHPRLSSVLRTSHGYSAVAFIGLTGFGFFPTYVAEAVYFTQVAKDIWELKVALTFLSTLMFLGNKVIL